MKFKSLQMRVVIIFGVCFLLTVAVLVVYEIVAMKNTEKFVTGAASQAAGDKVLAMARVI